MEFLLFVRAAGGSSEPGPPLSAEPRVFLAPASGVIAGAMLHP